jgi:hypothetical protein
MKIAVDIKTHNYGRICSGRCHFFTAHVMSDYCSLFGHLERVSKPPEKLRFISWRHKNCCWSEVSE